MHHEQHLTGIGWLIIARPDDCRRAEGDDLRSAHIQDKLQRLCFTAVVGNGAVDRQRLIFIDLQFRITGLLGVDGPEVNDPPQPMTDGTGNQLSGASHIDLFDQAMVSSGDGYECSKMINYFTTLKQGVD